MDSADYLWLSRLQTLVICGHFRLSGWFCDHKVSKRSSAQRDRRRSCTPGVVWRPLNLASPDHTPARGSPRRNRPRAADARPNRPAINSTTASNDATHRARSTMQQSSPPNRPPPLTTRQTAVAVPVRRRLGSPSSIAELVLSEIKLILAKLTQGPAVMADRRYPLPAAPKSDHA